MRHGVLEGNGLTNASQIGYGSNRKTRHMMPSGHKAFVVNNVADVDLLLMHNSTFAAEYVCPAVPSTTPGTNSSPGSHTPSQHESASTSSPGPSRLVSR